MKKNIDNNTIARNKKAFFDYEIIERMEAGIELLGSEVKAVKLGKISIKESFGKFKRNELFLVNMNIAEYENANIFNHDLKRERKILLHRKELRRLQIKVETAGMTIVPLSVYKKKHLIKVEIALVKGKREFDKRNTIKDRENKRNLDRVMKHYQNR